MNPLPLRTRLRTPLDHHLPFVVYTVGTEQQLPLTRLRGFSAHQLMFTFGGTGRFRRLGQERWELLQPGDLLHMAAGTPHEYGPAGEEPWQIGFITYTASGPGLQSARDMCPEGEVFRLRSSRGIHSILEQLWRMLELESEEEPWASTSALFRLFLEIRKQLLPGEGRDMTEPAPEDSPVQPAVRFMHDYLHRDLSMSELAGYVGYTPRHFTRLFRREMSTTPLQYLQRLRLQTASRLLNEYPDMTIRQAAAYVGMDAEYFSRLFRRAYGRLPSERSPDRPLRP